MFERLRPMIERKSQALPATRVSPGVFTPPTDSRAAARGLLVRLCPESLDGLDWSAIRVAPSGLGEPIAIPLGDPFRFGASELGELGLSEHSGEEAIATLLVATIRHDNDFRDKPVDPTRARSLAAVAALGTPAEALALHDAVSNGLRNFVQAQILKGHRDRLSEAIDMLTLVARGTSNPVLAIRRLEETLAECRVRVTEDPGLSGDCAVAMDLAEWAHLDAAGRAAGRSASSEVGR